MASSYNLTLSFCGENSGKAERIKSGYEPETNSNRHNSDFMSLNEKVNQSHISNTQNSGIKYTPLSKNALPVITKDARGLLYENERINKTFLSLHENAPLVMLSSYVIIVTDDGRKVS